MNKHILMILKSLAANYPIMYSLGARFTKLLVLFVDPGQTHNAVRTLSTFGVCALNEYMKPAEAETQLKNANSEFVIFPYSGRKKAKVLLDYLLSYVKNVSIANESAAVLPIVITEIGFIDDGELDMFFVHLEGSLDNYDIPLGEIVPQDNCLPMIGEQINNLSQNFLNSEEYTLTLAVCFLFLTFRGGRSETEWNVLLRTAHFLAVKDENSHMLDDIGEVFIDALYNWQRNEKFSEIYKLPNLDRHITKRLNQVLLFNTKYVFIPETIFRSICTPLLETFSINTIKSGLVESEILLPESKRTYSAKFGFYNDTGYYNRARALRLDKMRLNRTGELDFVDACVLTGRKK